MSKSGLIHIYTGDGKGKTTAAMGLAVRAAGYNRKVYILQFLKARTTGEKNTLAGMSTVTFKRANKSKKFIFQMDEAEKAVLVRETAEVWENLFEIIQESDYQLVIIDEIMGAITNGLVPLEKVIELIEKKADDKELVMTGRNAPEELVELADYVTEMKMIKHPFTDDIPARKGIEF